MDRYLYLLMSEYSPTLDRYILRKWLVASINPPCQQLRASWITKWILIRSSSNSSRQHEQIVRSLFLFLWANGFGKHSNRGAMWLQNGNQAWGQFSLSGERAIKQRCLWFHIQDTLQPPSQDINSVFGRAVRGGRGGGGGSICHASAPQGDGHIPGVFWRERVWKDYTQPLINDGNLWAPIQNPLRSKQQFGIEDKISVCRDRDI